MPRKRGTANNKSEKTANELAGSPDFHVLPVGAGEEGEQDWGGADIELTEEDELALDRAWEEFNLETGGFWDEEGNRRDGHYVDDQDRLRDGQTHQVIDDMTKQPISPQPPEVVAELERRSGGTWP